MILTSPMLQLVNKRILFIAMLYACILLLSLGVIYNRHSIRLQHVQLEQIYQQRDKLQDSWSQLLLEHGTWGSDVRVEKIAVEQLNMTTPKRIQVIKP